MLGVLTFGLGVPLSLAVAHAERLGCSVLHARKPAPNAGAVVDVVMDQSAANEVALAVLRREVRFTSSAEVRRIAN